MHNKVFFDLKKNKHKSDMLDKIYNQKFSQIAGHVAFGSIDFGETDRCLGLDSFVGPEENVR
jgi:hypothetical protein